MPTEPKIRNATARDLDRLVELEEKVFKSDRFTRRQFKYLLTRAKARILVIELNEKLVGAAVMLWRKSIGLARLYDIFIDPAMHGRGLGKILLKVCEDESVKNRCRTVHLEVRVDNTNAIAFYKKVGYHDIGTEDDYYTDGTPALKMEKVLNRFNPEQMHLKIPYYAQTEEFSCGPASLMMIFKHFKPDLSLTRTLEMILWKEATLIYMTSGFGGTGPFGLALAAQRRGFPTKVILSKDQPPFFSSVRDEDRRKVIRLVHKDMKKKALDLGVEADYKNFSFEDIVAAMKTGKIAVVLISTYHLHGDRAPHWVVVTGYDNDNVYFHDSYEKFYEEETDLARDVKIPLEEFRQMRRYGKDLYKSVILIGPPGKGVKAKLDMDGTIL